MRIATWNVNSLKARLEKVIWWLDRAKPDVLLMQETKLADADAPVQTFQQAGYELVHHGEGRWNGVAIASRCGIRGVITNFGEPLRSARTSEVGDDEPLAEARMVAAECGGVRVICVYAPNGRLVGSPFYEAKLVWFDKLARWIKQAVTPDTPAVIGGDFNVAPEDVDVWDPRACHGGTHVSERERKAFGRLSSAGFVDAYRLHHQEPGRYTWWDYRAGNFHKGLGLRIDYVLTTPDLADRVERCGMARDYRKGKKPSDHAPLMAQIGPADDGIVIPDASDSKQV
jgi:exodeoxyribonuclease III